jgi:outer membrane protein assembly factor BamD (BamD/ComL family)
MKKLFFFFLIVAGVALLLVRNVQNGKFDAFLDTHGTKAVNSNIQFYMASACELLHKNDSAKLRFKKVFEKYPDVPLAPLAMAEYISIASVQGGQIAEVYAICRGFMEKYPNHPKAVLIKRRMEILDTLKDI